MEFNTQPQGPARLAGEGERPLSHAHAQGNRHFDISLSSDPQPRLSSNLHAPQSPPSTNGVTALTGREAAAVKAIRDDRTRVNRRHLRLEQREFENEQDWNLAGLFDEDAEELEGAVGYSGPLEDYDIKRVWREYSPKKYLSKSLIQSRVETQRLLLLSLLQIKSRSPRHTPEVAWQAFVNWLKREGVIERDTEAGLLWMYAFREAPRAHFHQLSLCSAAALSEMWSSLSEEF